MPPEVTPDLSYFSLRRLIKGSSSSFSCSGSIPITTDASVEEYGHVPTKSRPVRIFWTSRDSVPHVLVLPVCEKDDIDASGAGALQQLISDCAPACFRECGKRILDPTFGKAGTLNPAHFATTFHPVDLGILDEIEKQLLPSFNVDASRKLIADLWKLEVFSSPDGFFKNHTNIPYSENQFGSLVVCLPSRFTGGNLYVRHNKQVRDLDWSPASSSTIQWAAFYDDCEREIVPVIEGKLITLVYRLHAVDAGVRYVHPRSSLTPCMQPLKAAVMRILGSSDLMRQGGILGAFCSYAYPASESIAHVLKDGDYLLYSAFKSCGLDTFALAISSTGDWYATILERAQSKNIPIQNDERNKAAKVMASEAWPCITLPGVRWVNEQNRNNSALRHCPRDTGAASSSGYGNDTHRPTKKRKIDQSKTPPYVDGAILAVIPPWGVRL
ncbi:oxidoreductase [Aspergillus vadensis CBS 113365]|uniref:Oxidoreductase n=1 Tax=Aspergillus vadensis (strain CBS 113365 / IMI 142717 / IBT 24658) TaxID=1448311 RepID=A0A319BG66_ASPVC|nr:oxidoreductase [Aspergillus vadensis CBS 113365]PYH69790.1 oxidoreductase [Aspergillus vadensis CBS 113365]